MIGDTEAGAAHVGGEHGVEPGAVDADGTHADAAVDECDRPAVGGPPAGERTRAALRERRERTGTRAVEIRRPQRQVAVLLLLEVRDPTGRGERLPTLRPRDVRRSDADGGDASQRGQDDGARTDRDEERHGQVRNQPSDVPHVLNNRLMPDPLTAAKTFMAALETNDAEKAAAVCADDVAIVLPGGDSQLEGKEGARRLIRMAPPFVRLVRDEEVAGNIVTLRGLTRSPGHFANYTTWTFETDGDLITHVTFDWKPAN